MPEFLGLPCVELRNEVLSLLVTETVGPRILSLGIHGGENLFAEVPDYTLDCPEAGKYHLWGGHRFWVAPEEPRKTYLPDDRPVNIELSRGALLATQPVDESTGLQKSLGIHLVRNEPIVIVNHTLKNLGPAVLNCAPWAITAFKPGGFGVLSHGPKLPDGAGLLPDRQFKLWPYTDIRSPFIDWGNQYTFVHAQMSSGALKLGCADHGTLGYYRGRTLFAKSALRSSSECYCNDRFLELETVGPMGAIDSGQSVTHSETWWVFDNVEVEATEASMSALKYPDLKEAR